MSREGLLRLGAGMRQPGRRRLEWEVLWDPQETGTRGGCDRGCAAELEMRLGDWN